MAHLINSGCCNSTWRYILSIGNQPTWRQLLQAAVGYVAAAASATSTCQATTDICGAAADLAESAMTHGTVLHHTPLNHSKA